MAERRLGDDDQKRLGDIGEGAFRELCIKAGLKWSKVEPDETGKDFIVEWPLARLDPLVSYDTRLPPRQVLVQVKSVLPETDRVKITLSNAERLAGDLRPAIIAIFRIDFPSLDVQNMHIVHILDKPLEQILKRLRFAQKKQIPKLNEAETTFVVDRQTPVDRTSSALYAALSFLVGESMDAYAVKKQKQRTSVGFDDDRYGLTLSFSTDSKVELLDGLLGLRPLKIHDLKQFERRWKIELPGNWLPGHDWKAATLTVSPEPIKLGRLIASRQENSASVACSVFGVHASVAGMTRLSFRWKFGSLEIEDDTANFFFEPSKIKSFAGTIQEWIDLFEFINVLSSPGADLRFATETQSVSLGVPDKALGTGWTKALGMLQKYQVVFRALRTGETDLLSSTDFLKSQRTVDLLAELLSNYFRIETTTRSPPVPRLDNLRATLVSTVQVGERWVGMSLALMVNIEKRQKKWHWQLEKNGTPHLEVLEGDTIPAFEAFQSRIKGIARPELWLTLEPGKLLHDGKMSMEVVDPSP